MSGFLGPIVGEAEWLVGRQAPVMFGDLLLEGHEVPARISLGGAQRLTIHRLPGGLRVIDAMGADDATITWHGVFIGLGAAERARQLDFMRMSGRPYLLSFGDYTITVIVAHLQYDYQDRGAVINYRISSEIVPTGSSLEAEPSLEFAIQNDLTTAVNIIIAGAVAASGYSALADRKGMAVLAANAGLLGATAASLTAAAAGFALEKGAAATGPTIAGVTGCGNMLQTTVTATTSLNRIDLADPLFASSGQLAVAAGQASALASAVRAGGYVNRAATNMSAASSTVVEPSVQA